MTTRITRLVIDGDIITFPPYLQEVLALVALGRTNKEIASQLHKSYRNVKNQITELLTIAGVGNRTELALLAHGIHPHHPRGLIPRLRQDLDT